MEQKIAKKKEVVPAINEKDLKAENLRIFQTALLKKDLKMLATVLHNQFIYFDDKNKQKTLKWFKKQFDYPIPAEYYTNEVVSTFCLSCQPGNTALIFHKGYWPKPDDFNYPKALMVSFTNGLISDLTLCFRYSKEGKMEKFIEGN